MMVVPFQVNVIIVIGFWFSSPSTGVSRIGTQKILKTFESCMGPRDIFRIGFRVHWPAPSTINFAVRSSSCRI